MDSIKITLPEVTRLANEIRNINVRLNDSLLSCKQEMNALSNVWESAGASEIIARFEHFSLRFNEEYETIENYARFLDQTVASYDSLEATIKANAGNFA